MRIEKVDGPVYSQCRIPGMVVTQQGTLLAYYECRKTKCDWAEIDIKIIRSTDEGASWQQVMLTEGKGNTLNNPVMFVNGGQLHFLFLKNYKALFHCVSTDDGMTFSEPREMTISSDRFYNVVAVGPGHGIVHKGRMIVPVWFAYNREEELAHRPSVIATLYSADGETWQLGEYVGETVLVNPSECALAVTADNKILISIRNENEEPYRAFAVSEDGVSGWTVPRFDPRFPDPVCMGSMTHEQGTVYHINCESETKREDLVIKVSRDGFQSFESIFVDTPAGYSDIAVKEGALYVLYERDSTNGGLYFQRIKR